jgi:arabinose-5-phosphate isomerase
MALLEFKGFNSNQFKNFHPGGNLGKDLKKISDIMHVGKSLPLAKETDRMSKTLITMTKKSFGCVGVINKKQQLVGIITDGDLRKKMNNKLFNLTSSEIMTKNPTIGGKNMLVGEVLNIMNTKKITNLFICENNKPIGIIHIHDLLRMSS